jgi:uncharacterized protein YndB with AHSA1/START domain
MASSNAAPETTLQLRRTFAASPETLYRAWTARHVLEQWMCRDVNTQAAKYHELDVRPGGHYVMEVHDAADGKVYVGRGVFREVRPPERLVFTWGWTTKQPDGSEAPLHAESQVTVEFRAQGRGTEVILTHEFIQTEKLRKGTEKGWQGCLDALALALEKA